MLAQFESILLFFAAYIICSKNYSFSRVVFYFFQSKIANSSSPKINDSSEVRTTGFSSTRSGFESRVPNIFMISRTFFRNSIPMVPIAQWVAQQGSKAVGPGSSLCCAKYFYDFIDICQKFQLFPWHSGLDNRVLKR